MVPTKVRIKMTRNRHGSPDGVTVNHYEADTEHDLPESLAKVFVEDDKVAEYVKASKAEDPVAAAAKEAEKEAKAQAAAKAKAEKEAKNKAEKELKNK